MSRDQNLTAPTFLNLFTEGKSGLRTLRKAFLMLQLCDLCGAAVKIFAFFAKISLLMAR
jgi:hypothetical protein